MRTFYGLLCVLPISRRLKTEDEKSYYTAPFFQDGDSLAQIEQKVNTAVREKRAHFLDADFSNRTWGVSILPRRKITDGLLLNSFVLLVDIQAWNNPDEFENSRCYLWAGRILPNVAGREHEGPNRVIEATTDRSMSGILQKLINPTRTSVVVEQCNSPEAIINFLIACADAESSSKRGLLRGAKNHPSKWRRRNDAGRA